MTRYKMVRIKLEDYEQLMKKKSNLKRDIENIAGKPIKFSTPQFFTAFAKGSLLIDPNSVIKRKNKKIWLF